MTTTRDPDGVPATRTRPPATGPAFAIVVLTWNGRDDTLDCLASLTPQLRSDDRVVVLDNASVDGTEAAVRARFADCEVVQNGANLGFAGGNNPGLRRALAAGFEWILLLNNDTVVPHGALDALRRCAADVAPDVGVLQPLLVRDSEPTRIDSAGHGLDATPGVHELLAGEDVARAGSIPIAVFGACGAAALFRRSALDAAGLLDERLFVLFEDVDLMFRVRMHGFGVLLVPAVQIRHRRGVSGAAAVRSARSRRRRRAFVQRNIVTLALRYWPTAALWRVAPELAFRALDAVVTGKRCGVDGARALWWSAWRARRATRRAMRDAGVDGWFGRRPFGT